MGGQFERFFKRFGLPGPEDDERKPGSSGGRSQAQGSGFFVSADGYIVTNNHVVEHASEVTVITDSGKTLTAKVIGSDPKTDIALLKAEGSDFPAVRFAAKPPRVGDWVIAVGNPFGLGGTVTAGIVSARGRDIGSGPYDDFIQIDAPVNHGNSGGPAFNNDGEVVGVNTAIFSPSGGSVGIGFAISADVVQTVVQQLKDHGSVSRGWLGVEIQQVTPDLAESLGVKPDTGALVAKQTGRLARGSGGRESRRRDRSYRRADRKQSAGPCPARRGIGAEKKRRPDPYARRPGDPSECDAGGDAFGQGAGSGGTQARAHSRAGLSPAWAGSGLGARERRRRPDCRR